MLEVRKSTTLSGTISVDVEEATGEGTHTVPVVYMSASVGEDSSPSITKSIQSKEIYLSHKEEIKQDISEFEDMVDELIQ